jgi:hypothetical protein
MRNHQIPTIVDYVVDITLIMLPGYLGWQQVTRPCVMTFGFKRFTNNTAKFACNQYPHNITPNASYVKNTTISASNSLSCQV